MVDGPDFGQVWKDGVWAQGLLDSQTIQFRVSDISLTSSYLV